MNGGSFRSQYLLPECRCTRVVGADLRARQHTLRAQNAIGVLHAKIQGCVLRIEFLSRLSGDMGHNRSERFAVTISHMQTRPAFPEGTPSCPPDPRRTFRPLYALNSLLMSVRGKPPV